MRDDACGGAIIYYSEMRSGNRQIERIAVDEFEQQCAEEKIVGDRDDAALGARRENVEAVTRAGLQIGDRFEAGYSESSPRVERHKYAYIHYSFAQFFAAGDLI